MSFTKLDNEIFNDNNLTFKEFKLLTVLIRYYNTDLGYSFPSIKTLCQHMATTNTTSIHNVIKSLIEKGYVKKAKNKRNNIYFDIKYLVIETEEKAVKPAQEPAAGQAQTTPQEVAPATEHIETVIDEDAKKVAEIIQMPAAKAAELIKIAGGDIDKVINYYCYAAGKSGVKSLYKYIKWCIENNLEITKKDYKSSGNTRGNLKTDNSDWRTNKHKYVYWIDGEMTSAQDQRGDNVDTNALQKYLAAKSN